MPYQPYITGVWYNGRFMGRGWTYRTGISGYLGETDQSMPRLKTVTVALGAMTCDEVVCESSVWISACQEIPWTGESAAADP